MALERRLLSGRIGMPAFTASLPVGSLHLPSNITYGIGELSGGAGVPISNGGTPTNGGNGAGQSTFDWDSLIDAVGGIAPNIIDALKGTGLTGLSTLGGLSGRRIYNNVFIQNGKVKVPTGSGYRTLGYTAAFAKKKYKTRRRRKRLTKRDMAIIAAIQQNPQSSAALAMMM